MTAAHDTGSGLVRLLLSLCSEACTPLTAGDLAELVPEFGTAGVLSEAVAGARVWLLIGDGSAETPYRFRDAAAGAAFRAHTARPSDLRAAHDRFVAWGDRWWRSPDTPPAAYIREYWASHLAAGARWERLREVLTCPSGHGELRWATVRRGPHDSYAGYLADLNLLWANAEQTGDLVLGVRCAVFHAAARTRAGWMPAELVTALSVVPGDDSWSSEQALAYVRDIPNEYEQMRAVCCLAHMHRATLAGVPALEIARGIRSEDYRWSSLSALTRFLSPPEVRELVAEARKRECAEHQVEALAPLIEYLEGGDREALLGEALAAVARVGLPSSHARAAAHVAPSLAPARRTKFLRSALDRIQRCPEEREQAEALSVLAAELPAPLVREAVEIARKLGDERIRRFTLAELVGGLPEDERSLLVDELRRSLFTADGADGSLSALWPLHSHLPEPERSHVLAATLVELERDAPEQRSVDRLQALLHAAPFGVLPQMLNVARAMPAGFERARALASAAVYLPEKDEAAAVLRDAYLNVPALDDLWNEPAALPYLLPYLSGSECARMVTRFLDSSLRVRQEYTRAANLSALAPHLGAAEATCTIDAALALRDPYERATALGAFSTLMPGNLCEDDRLRVSAALQQIIPPASDVLGEIFLLENTHRGLSPEALHERCAALLEATWDLREAPYTFSSAGAARMVMGGSPPYVTLRRLLPILSSDLMERALVMVRAIQSEDDRAELFTMWLARAPTDLIPLAYRVARDFAASEPRVAALAALVARLEEPERSATLREALAATRNIADQEQRAAALATLLPVRPDREVGVAEVLELIQDAQHRLDALLSVAEYLGLEQQQESLTLLRAVGDPQVQAHGLAQLAVRLPQGLAVEALRLCCHRLPFWYTPEVLSVLAPRLGGWTGSEARSVAAEVHRALAQGDRVEFLTAEAALLPWLVQLDPRLPEELWDAYQTADCFWAGAPTAASPDPAW